MVSIQKIQIPEGTGFDRKVAMELANLISVAYNEYEVWDANEELQQESKLPILIVQSFLIFSRRLYIMADKTLKALVNTVIKALPQDIAVCSRTRYNVTGHKSC